MFEINYYLINLQDVKYVYIMSCINMNITCDQRHCRKLEKLFNFKTDLIFLNKTQALQANTGNNIMYKNVPIQFNLLAKHWEQYRNLK